MLNPLKTLSLVVAFACFMQAEGDLDRFKSRADDLSRQLTLKVERHTEEVGGQIRGVTNYLIRAKGHTLTLNVLEETPTPETMKRLSEASGEDSFVSGRVQTLFGPLLLVEAIRHETTKEASARIIPLVEAREILEKQPETPERKKQIARLWQEGANIVHLDRDERSLANGMIDFNVASPAGPNEQTRFLSIYGLRLEGQNPFSSGGGLHLLPMSAQGSHKIESRSYGGTLAELENAGLVEAGGLAAIRGSYWGLPIDYWTPLGARALETPIPLGLNAALPGLDGPKSSVVIGKHIFMPETTPALAKNLKSGQPLDTFLISRFRTDQLNPFVDCERPASSNWVDLRFDKAKNFPIAGMHENGRVFVSFWVVLASHQGILSVVQYADEGAPRIAVFDPSGIIIKLAWGEAVFGCLATEKKPVDQPAKVVWHPTSITHGRTPEGARFREIIRMTLPSDASGTSIGPLDGAKAETHSVELALPRALW